MEHEVAIDGDDSQLVRLELTYHEVCVLVDLMHGPVSKAQRTRKGQENTLLLTSVYRKALAAVDGAVMEAKKREDT
jgi:hypothetical protein